jgi:hypothetical protein
LFLTTGSLTAVMPGVPAKARSTCSACAALAITVTGWP